jgi:4a-hydroxytetrahydrobiopterin dehydratase
MQEQACNLADKHCLPCEAGVPRYSKAEALKKMALLNNNWELDEAGLVLTRRFEFKGFAKVMYFVNTLAWLADREGHHPDVSFGWGYCTVQLSTHAIEGLSENDFICAAKIDQLEKT